MKLITLNTWGGRVKDLNKSFFDKYRDTNIWCLQEMHHKGVTQVHIPGLEIDYQLLDTVQECFPEHEREFCPAYKNIMETQLSFVKK